MFNYVKTYIFEKYSSMLSQLDEDFIYSIFNSKNLSFSSNSLSWEVDLTYLGAGGFNQNLRDSIRNLLNSAGSALKLKFVLSFQLVKLEQRATYDSRTRILTPTDETFELKYKEVMYI